MNHLQIDDNVFVIKEENKGKPVHSSTWCTACV